MPSSGSTIQTRDADEPGGVVGAFLGQDRVVGVRLRQRGDDEVVRRPVALRLDLGGVGAGRVQGGAQGDQALARLGGDGGRGAVVVGGGGLGGKAVTAGDATPSKIRLVRSAFRR